MKRTISNRNKKSRSSRNEDLKVTLRRLRTEEEKLRRRREWLIQQKLELQHERLKKERILEYELRRARKKNLLVLKGRSHHSKSRSASPMSRHRKPSVSSTSRVVALSEKLLGGTMPLFKGPTGTRISETELRKIKIDIHRNIPAKAPTTELQRDIVNPDDVVLKRRDGEGTKPIFEREEIKQAITGTKEVEEHRIVAAISSSGKSEARKKRSSSLNSFKVRICSRRRTSSRHSRFVSELVRILCKHTKLSYLCMRFMYSFKKLN